MKKILNIFLLAAIILTGCKKEEKPEKDNTDYAAAILGCWHHEQAELEIDIYVEFEEDGSYNLYQKIGGGRHKHYEGSWTVEGNTLSGHYSDGLQWGSTYRLKATDKDTITMTALNGSEEVITYNRESIPEEILQQAQPSLRMLNSQPQYRWL